MADSGKNLLKSPAAFIDHTLLKADTTSEAIAQLCEEAVEHGFASVCIPPIFVAQASEMLYGSEVAVGTVVGFPLGYVSAPVKAFETARAVSAGAQEVDMVISLAAALEGRFSDVEQEVRQVVESAEGATVKVILECCCLPDHAVKQELVHRCVEAGAAFVKTSTGFGSGGATLEDVTLMVQAAAGRVGVKAAGGIRDWARCEAYLEAGARRIGTSSGIAIVEQWRRQVGV